MREDINEAILVGALKAVRDEAKAIATKFLSEDDKKTARDELAELMAGAEQLIELLANLDEADDAEAETDA
jgi:hypothetical protein